MSDELERRLREAGHRLPNPDPDHTRAARARFLAAASARRSRRPLVLALAAALAVGGAFGVGYAVASSGNPPPKTIVKRVPARLDAGPGFLPSPGWATTVAIDPATGAIDWARAVGGPVRIEAAFSPASSTSRLRRRLLPMPLPPGGRVRRLRAHVGAYAVDVTITFASARPSSATLVAAREELGRLVVPSCPSARPLTSASGAGLYVLQWLPAHYSGNASDLVGAHASAKLGSSMPRYGEAVADCGRVVASRSVEVDVVLPKVAKISASLSQLTYFVAKTAQGWIVWERAR